MGVGTKISRVHARAAARYLFRRRLPRLPHPQPVTNVPKRAIHALRGFVLARQVQVLAVTEPAIAPRLRGQNALAVGGTTMSGRPEVDDPAGLRLPPVEDGADHQAGEE